MHVSRPRKMHVGIFVGGLPLTCLSRSGRLNPSLNKFQEFENMVIIRLARSGSKKRPFFNIVAANSLDRRDGRFIERVGFYNPVAAGSAEGLRVAFDRVTYWKSVGARISPTVARLVKQAASAPAVAPAAAAAPAAPAAEAPAEGAAA